MRYLALVADYDGTLASHGTVPDETVRAIERLRTSGRRAILVTGRRLHDLLAVFAQAAGRTVGSVEFLWDQIPASDG